MKKGQIDRSKKSSKFPSINWCEWMSGTSKKINPFVKLILDTMKAAAPNFFVKCSFTGITKAENVTVLRPIKILMPVGSFRIILNVTDENNAFLWGYVLDIEFT
jgi:hypothetical protein